MGTDNVSEAKMANRVQKGDCILSPCDVADSNWPAFAGSRGLPARMYDMGKVTRHGEIQVVGQDGCLFCLTCQGISANVLNYPDTLPSTALKFSATFCDQAGVAVQG